MNLNSLYLYYVCCMLHPNSYYFPTKGSEYIRCVVYICLCVCLFAHELTYTHTFKLITQTGSVWNIDFSLEKLVPILCIHMYVYYISYISVLYYHKYELNTYMMGQWNFIIHSSIRYVQAGRLFIFFIYSFIIYYDYMSITPSLLYMFYIRRYIWKRRL